MTVVEARSILEVTVDQVNQRMRDAASNLPWHDPVAAVQWIHIDRIQANDYNPNSVAFHEMRLLHVSISEDGYTQPIVAIFDPLAGPAIDPSGQPSGMYVIVDGFHRYTVMRKFEQIHNERSGYLPVVVLDKSIADRMASTVRHNRARGKHSVAGMGALVFQMLREGLSDAEICNKIGLEAEELARLKHVTGFSKLYVDAEYSRPVLITPQIQAKAAYQREHPDEHVPTDF